MTYKIRIRLEVEKLFFYINQYHRLLDGTSLLQPITYSTLSCIYPALPIQEFIDTARVRRQNCLAVWLLQLILYSTSIKIMRYGIFNKEFLPSDWAPITGLFPA